MDDPEGPMAVAAVLVVLAGEVPLEVRVVVPGCFDPGCLAAFFAVLALVAVDFPVLGFLDLAPAAPVFDVLLAPVVPLLPEPFPGV